MDYLEKVYDVTSGEMTEIPYTDEQIAEAKANEKETEANAKAIKAEAEARATKKAALLDRLGITDAEAKLLLS